jgi:tRNA (cmo5U34)-methyltransferase
MDNRPFDFEADYGANYDTFIRQVIPGYDSLHALAGAMLEPACPANSRILVIGCGSGTEIICLGRLYPHWRFVGVDSSPAMIRQCSERLHSLEMAHRATLVTGTMDDLDTNTVYDGATCILVSHFIAGERNKTNLFASISQRIKPDGRLVVADACLEKSSEFRAMMACRWSFAKAHGASEDRYKRFQEDCRTSLQSVSPDLEEHIIQQAGFASVRRFFTSLHINAWLASRDEIVD